MSPDSPSFEMNEISTRVSTKLSLSQDIELNNNVTRDNIDDVERTQIHSIDSNSNIRNKDGRRFEFVNIDRRRNEQSDEDKDERNRFAGVEGVRKKIISDSSSSSNSGSTESLDLGLKAGENVRRLSAGASQVSEKEVTSRQVRSMSDGAANIQDSENGDISVFPSLQDNVLESMGLLGDGPRERLTEEEIEIKFQTLTLAFTIDSVTIADRRTRQLRQRNQAEDNMTSEIARLVHAIHRLNPLCIDAEKTELVTSLLGQLDIIIQASKRISTSAEVFGSVQQEWRLAESVNLMLNHLRNLKQQRDMARRQLQCTKRMLQESTETPTAHAGRLRIPTTANGKVVTRRRASIATIPKPLEAKTVIGINSADRRLPRRTSAACSGEISPRLWDSRARLEWNDRLPPFSRSARPSRLELGVDLVKIREGTVESALSINSEEKSECEESDSESYDFKTPTLFPEEEFPDEELELLEPPTYMRRMGRRLQRVGARIGDCWNTLAEEGTLHEFCCLGAIICFCLCTIIIGNLILEIEYAKRGLAVQKIPWAWTTFEEIIAPFVTINYPDGPPPN